MPSAGSDNSTWRETGGKPARAHPAEKPARPDALLFCFPDPIREASARKRLHGVRGLVLATASWDRVGQEPLGAVWLPIDSDRRARLTDVPAISDHSFEKRAGGIP
jgi:hypothetical protein